MTSPARKTVHLLDYGAGNVRSLINAVNKLGFEVEYVKSPADLDTVSSLIFPGVGAFGAAIENLSAAGYLDPLRKYITSGRPFFGICVGMQSLFETSDESPGVEGLGVIPGKVQRISSELKTVPHIGWNTASPIYTYKDSLSELNHLGQATRYYFVHSFGVVYSKELEDWAYSLTRYGDEVLVSSVRKGNVFATQFHPEKSGKAGLAVIKSFLEYTSTYSTSSIDPLNVCSRELNAAVATDVLALASQYKRESTDHVSPPSGNGLTKRIVACMDVRANDNGDLVVTKGDQYNVRETPTDSSTSKGEVRNMGKPIELARRYYEEGADEITFLNITAFRGMPVRDLPLLAMLREASRHIFVPVTIGGGIRDTREPSGEIVLAADVAASYFRSGADKVSIGSDAVYAAEQYYSRGKKLLGDTSIEQISQRYGAQAVVISVDPKRKYVNLTTQEGQDEAKNLEKRGITLVQTQEPGPHGETHVWFQCTVKGGREARDIDVAQLVTACAALGAGEILVNSIDRDGSGRGFDSELLHTAREAVAVPVVASSGAGSVQHFIDVFATTGVDAALAAGIFHRKEVSIEDVRSALAV